MCVHAHSLQLCPTVCHPTVCSPPGSSIHKILPVSILKWDAMASSRGIFLTQGRTHVSCVFCVGRGILYHQCHLEDLKNSINQIDLIDTYRTLYQQQNNIFQVHTVIHQDRLYSDSKATKYKKIQVICSMTTVELIQESTTEISGKSSNIWKL